MDKNAAPAPSCETRDILSDIISTLRPSLNGRGEVQFYTIIAKRIGAIAGKDWGWRYVMSVSAGTMQPSKLFAGAVKTFAAILDGLPVSVAGTEPVTCHAQPGLVRHDSVILLAAQPCAFPGCGVWIVSRGRYCCEDHRRAMRRLRDQQRRGAK